MDGVAVDPRYPLGTPTNRKDSTPTPQPVPGRPNWFFDKAGEPKYIEPSDQPAGDAK